MAKYVDPTKLAKCLTDWARENKHSFSEPELDSLIEELAECFYDMEEDE